jgi:hypothetical protein
VVGYIIKNLGVTIFNNGIQAIEQRTFTNVNIYWNTENYLYLETSVGHNSNPYLNVAHFFNTSVN